MIRTTILALAAVATLGAAAGTAEAHHRPGHRGYGFDCYGCGGGYGRGGKPYVPKPSNPGKPYVPKPSN